MISVCSGVGNQEETVVVEDISSITRRTFGSVVDPHANGGLFVGCETAPVGLLANSARSIFSSSTKAVDPNSLSLRKDDDPALVGIRNMN